MSIFMNPLIQGFGFVIICFAFILGPGLVFWVSMKIKELFITNFPKIKTTIKDFIFEEVEQ